jgi:hypothetical protein
MITYTKHNMGFSLLFLKGSSRMGMSIGYCTEKTYVQSALSFTHGDETSYCHE